MRSQADVKSYWWQLGQRYFVLLFGSGATWLLSFLITLMLSRQLGPEDYGRFTLFLTVAQTVICLTSFWAGFSILKLGTEESIKQGSLYRVFWAQWSVLLPLLALVVVGMVILREKVGHFHAIHGLSVGWIALYVLASIWFQAAQSIYQALQRVNRVAVIQIGEGLLLFAGILFLNYWSKSQWLVPVIRWYAIATAIAAFFAFLTLDASIWLPIRTDRQMLSQLVRFSWPLIISNLGVYLMMNWIDLTFLRFWSRLSEVGQYYLAYQIMGTLQQLPVQTLPVVLPALVGFQSLGQSKATSHYHDWLLPRALLVMSALICFCLLTAPALIPLVFGRNFSASLKPLGVLLLALLFSTIFMGVMPLLKTANRTKPVMVAFLVGGFLKLVLDYWWIQKAGMVGAAWSTVAAHAACAGTVLIAAGWQAKAIWRLVPLLFLGLLASYFSFIDRTGWLWKTAGCLMVAAIGYYLCRRVGLSTSQQGRHQEPELAVASLQG